MTTQLIRMRGAGGEGMQLKKYEEILFPNLDPLDPERGVKYAEEFQYRPGDIIMCTYPKSGTHWMGNMLWKLKSNEQSDRPKDTVLEFGPPEAFVCQNSPRIISTQLKPSRLYPAHIEKKGKIVLMLRNPKDVVVSYYYHFKNAVVFRNKQTWDEFFHSFIEGEILMGSYFAYIREWEQMLQDIATGKSSLKVEVFYYEEFLVNPKENIRRLNNFLELNRDEGYLEKVLRETTLAALRDQYNDPRQNRTNAVCDDDQGKSVIFRKGKTGDWKTHLTVAQSETIDALLMDSLQHGIIKFQFHI